MLKAKNKTKINRFYIKIIRNKNYIVNKTYIKIRNLDQIKNLNQIKGLE